VKEFMKPVKQEANVVSQPPMEGPQKISDEQAIQLMNKMKTQGSGAIITLDEILTNFSQLFSIVVNQKNSEISALKEALALKAIDNKVKENLVKS